MTTGVTGWGILSAAGVGPQVFADALHGRRGTRHPIDTMYDEVLPEAQAHVVTDFDIKSHLGRKGTTFYDRGTGLALVATAQALEDSGLRVDDKNRRRVGVVFGTTAGSLSSTMTFSKDTLIQARPYLVNPALFPNTVMNTAAGQAAIRFQLKGVNTTLAGGPVAFLNVLRYAQNTLDRLRADALLVGAVEEFTPHSAWAGRHIGITPGEAAGVFVLERADEARRTGRQVHTELSPVVCRFSPGGPTVDAVLACADAALDQAATTWDALSHSLISGTDGPMAAHIRAAMALRAPRARQLDLEVTFGDCRAAAGVVQLAASLVVGAAAALMVGWSEDGALAAAVVRGCADVRGHRG
ncbi:beta-ketoacyl synthase N-terminal-like domain-containing protein [Nocardia iowensis]|uniref:Beta-ketoacyl synthase-like N-terminal domain-containing protein n=1 Tax=Nocardia iowensis TaxID=204891 RepID=A0ABX8RFT4_NOCIO|nr:beta-ketoacyl synthase N-terminal-like domain-containing protein [Nocardia iowensis]QXN88462.1 hypothetical protein KV110_22965 [Nocardia iowensis]